MSAIQPALLPSLVSGVYTRYDFGFSSRSGVKKVPVETVRLDVDGWYPQMLASGTYSTVSAFGGASDWRAGNLVEKSPGVWEGDMFKSSDTLVLPHQKVRIQVPRTAFAVRHARMTITFSGGAPAITNVLDYESPWFRTLDFESDVVVGSPRVMSVDTGAHANRPANLQRENLTLAAVYDRVGVDVTEKRDTNPIAVDGSGEDETWDDYELHDAMVTHWSQYKTARGTWKVWGLFADYHTDTDPDEQFLGIMFDNSDLKPNPIQRQGFAIFGHRIAEKVPAGDPQPAEWIRRERFFAAVHELGHCFNLTHSDEKRPGNWANDPGDFWASSFMNNPKAVDRAGGNFWGQFQYRFDNPEIAFIRHAPDEFVRMGGSAYGQNHGLIDREASSNPQLALGLTVARTRRVYEFLEPVNVELSLTNVSSVPQLVSSSLLEHVKDLSLAIQARGGVVQQWRPYARYCTLGHGAVLHPGESLAVSLFASAGVDGWYLAEPGSYTIRASMNTPYGRVAAEPLTLRIAAPQSRDEDLIAQNFFTDEVGRALAFRGTRVMSGAIEALQETAERLGDRAVARHALLTLANPIMKSSKVLQPADGDCPRKFARVEARPQEAQRLLHEALMNDSRAALETFGPLAYRQHVERFGNWLAEQCDDPASAEKARMALTGAQRIAL